MKVDKHVSLKIHAMLIMPELGKSSHIKIDTEKSRIIHMYSVWIIYSDTFYRHVTMEHPGSTSNVNELQLKL